MNNNYKKPFRCWKGLVLIAASPLLANGFCPPTKLQCGGSTMKTLVSETLTGARKWNAAPIRITSGEKNGSAILASKSNVPQSTNTTDLNKSSLGLSTVSLDGDSKNISDNPSFPLVVWRFTRPHTLIGSAVAIPAIHMLAAPSFKSIFTMSMLSSTIYAMIPALLMNLYITGLNQITDVEIDKINKPYLPIPNGDLSSKSAKKVVTVALFFSLLLGAIHPIYGTNGLNFALWGSAILGTMYSLPPLRLKRFPLLAAFCIVAVRGTVVNTGFYAHAMSAAFRESSATVLSCLMSDFKCQMSSLFFGVFGIVIALMKDVPDVKGDAIANIRTFTVRVGQKTIFHSMRRLVSMLFYSFGAGFLRGSLMALQNQEKFISLCRGCIALFAFRFGLKARNKGKNVNAEDSDEVFTYYMYLWKLFYASYLFLPFAK